MKDKKGYLIDIQNYSVNDGDGIRTVIFFAGCRLRCQWCSNPESFTSFNKVIHSTRSCIACGRCVTVCPYGCGMNLNQPEDRIKCKNCGLCVKVCPSRSRINLIFTYTVKQIVEMVERQKIFLLSSGGGVTYSGGEATMQAGFLRKLVNAFYDRSFHQAMETSGYFKFSEVCDIFEWLDLIFVDIKHMDSKKHRYFTGMNNDVILENIKRLNSYPLEMVIRIPAIVGVNADEENIVTTARFVKKYAKKAKIELLPYHAFGLSKYEALGLTYQRNSFGTPTAETMRRLKEIVESEGVDVVSYR